jgi:pseudouridine kinase
LDRKRIIVVGASALDIKGRGGGVWLSHSKNPGRIELAAGGVARNIAENLARLGLETILLTALNTNAYSQLIVRKTMSAGVNLDHALHDDSGRQAIFMAFLNQRGDMEAAVSDMSILELISPDYIGSKAHLFDDARFVVLDADIPEDTLSLCLDLAEERDIPTCIEPVSVAKARGMVPFLPRVSLVTPNREEAEVLVDRPVSGARGIIDAGEMLLERGVRKVVITLGPEGVYAASEEFRGFIPSISTVVIDSIGAGDALVAGTIFGLLEGKAFSDSVRTGIAAATLSITSGESVSPELSSDALERVLATTRAR